MAKLGPIGLALGALGTVSSFMAERQAAEAEARQAEINAAMAQQEAAENARRQRLQTDRDISKQRAAFGASGIVTTEGSPLLVQLDQAMEGELEALNILRQGQISANTFNLQRAQAKQRKKNAFGGLLSGASSLGLQASQSGMFGGS